MKISTQKSRHQKWGYTNWTNKPWVSGEGFEKPKFQITLYLGKIWVHLMH